MTRGMRRAAFVVGVIGIVATWARPADARSAPGQDPTNWRVTITAIAPATNGVVLRATDNSEQLEFRVDGDHTLVVFGYSGEPYLRVDRDGVWMNRRSPAGFLNRSLAPTAALPKRFDATAPADWRRLTREHFVRWHDHRTDHRAGAKRITWQVPITIDGHAGSIAGSTSYVAPRTASTAFMVGVIALGLATAIVMLWGRRGIVFLSSVIALTAIAQFVGHSRASTSPFLDQLGPTLYSVATLTAALVAAVIATRSHTPTRAASSLLAGVAIGVCGGLARIDWLTHSQLPTVLAHAAATSCVTLSLVIGAVLAASALRELLARPSP